MRKIAQFLGGGNEWLFFAGDYAKIKSITTGNRNIVIVRISNLGRTNRKFGTVLSFFAYYCGT